MKMKTILCVIITLSSLTFSQKHQELSTIHMADDTTGSADLHTSSEPETTLSHGVHTDATFQPFLKSQPNITSASAYTVSPTSLSTDTLGTSLHTVSAVPTSLSTHPVDPILVPTDLIGPTSLPTDTIGPASIKLPPVSPSHSPLFQGWLINEAIFINESFSPIHFIKSICPDMNSCQDANSSDANSSYSLYASEGEEICCVPCDCSDDCFAYGNCCHDKVGKPGLFIKNEEATRKGELCAYPDTIGGHLSYMRIQRRVSYILVSSCAAEYNGSSRGPCYLPKPSILDEVMPVYSSSTKLNYRNRHCAACNFAPDNLTTWLPHISCDSYMQSFMIMLHESSISNILDNILNFQQCTLEWKPSNKNHKTCIREEDVESDCTLTDSQDIQRLCDEIYMPFGYKGHFYKNVICFGCIVGGDGEEGKTIDNKSCILPEYRHCSSSSYAPSFDATLNQLLVSEKEDSHVFVPQKCTNGLTYNNALMRCLEVSCAPSMINIGGECVNALEELTGVGLEYRLSFSYPMKYDDLSTDVILRNARLFVTNGAEDYIISEKAHVGPVYNDSVAFDVRIIKYLGHLTNIRKDYISYETNVMTFNGDFVVKFDNSGHTMFPSEFSSYLSFSNATHLDPCFDTIAMSRLQFCQTVVVKMDDNAYIQDGLLMVSSVSFEQSEYVIREAAFRKNIFAQVCLDTYVSKMQFVSSSMRHQSHFVAIFLTLAHTMTSALK